MGLLRWLRDARLPGPTRPLPRESWPPCTKIADVRLVAECEAFLSGGLTDLLETKRPPVWTWTNLLAHGNGEDLRSASFDASCDDWRRARAYLASSLLALAATYGPLEEIQKQVLVPLELDLASRPEVRSWEPRGWASTVERALERYRRECRRASQQ